MFLTCVIISVPVRHTQSLAIHGYPDPVVSAGDMRHDRKQVSSIIRGGEDPCRWVVTVTDVCDDFCEDNFHSVSEVNVTIDLSIESDIWGEKIMY